MSMCVEFQSLGTGSDAEAAAPSKEKLIMEFLQILSKDTMGESDSSESEL